MLGAAQDEVIEEVTHNGWPPADSKNPEAPQFRAMLPQPRAEVASGVLRCWYGDPDNPALTLDDVPLDRL